jgi:hypothetical protein
MWENDTAMDSKEEHSGVYREVAGGQGAVGLGACGEFFFNLF